MITVIFMRHGEAVLAPSYQDDHKRNLTASGKSKVAAVALSCVKNGFTPSLILTSDAVRALETTKVVEQTMGLAPHLTRHCPDFYHADFAIVMDELVGIDGRHETTMLVGHNPGWSEIVSTLTNTKTSLNPGDACIIQCARNEPLSLAITAVGHWNLKVHLTG